MIQRFVTKRDINGNRYTLIIDHTNKTFTRDYNIWHYDGFKTIGKRERKQLINDCIAAGYTETGFCK